MMGPKEEWSGKHGERLEGGKGNPSGAIGPQFREKEGVLECAPSAARKKKNNGRGKEVKKRCF